MKCIHLVIDDDLYDTKAFYKEKNCFYTLFKSDDKFIN